MSSAYVYLETLEDPEEQSKESHQTWNKQEICMYQYYNVKEYQNGCIILEPRELSVPDSISRRTLNDMDKAVSNFNKGEVSSEVDLSDF